MHCNQIGELMLANKQNIKLWIKSGFSLPAPQQVKRHVLMRYGGRDLWVETGTYEAQTTRFLADNCRQVISIEPSDFYYEKALQKCKKKKNIKLIHGTSQSKLEEILATDISEFKTLSFWLDGHFCGGQTHFSGVRSPIVDELRIIQKFLGYECKITILIDDVRDFSRPGFHGEGYPTLYSLVSFAEKNHMYWTIEHDIFIMKQ